MKNINSKQEDIVNQMLDLMEKEGFLKGIDLVSDRLDELVKNKEITDPESDEIARYILQLFMGLFADTRN